MPLDRIIDPSHPLAKLSGQINWASFDETFGSLYSPGMGRPAKPTRLMVGLHYLKHSHDLSDEEVVARWMENPYWQYFCGGENFEHEFPIEPSLMTRWRKRLGEKGLEKLFEETIKTGLSTGALKPSALEKLNVDTTVQEKAITYPTDAKLYHRMREKLVRLAKKHGIELRQSYKFLSKKALFMQGVYSRSRKPRKSSGQVRKIKVYLGRVARDIGRNVAGKSDLAETFSASLALAQRILAQKRGDKGKVYSVHEPEVQCIAKGKAHKKYEFGCKVGIVATSRNPFIVGIKAFKGNPYDGHTLAECVEQAERLTGRKASELFVDKGYRGHNYKGEAAVHISGAKKNISKTLKRWLKRRASIEPVIGHAKDESRLGRNHLKGVEGDMMNALLAGCGQNIRRLLAALLLFLFGWRQKPEFCSAV
jgi:IS5 family transposase